MATYWQKVRRFVLKRDWLCCHCLVEYSTQVDHKIPIALGGGWDILENLQGLCEKCHGIKTIKDIMLIRDIKRYNKNEKLHEEMIDYYNHLFKGGNGDPNHEIVSMPMLRRSR